MNPVEFIRPVGDLLVRDPVSYVPLAKEGELKAFVGQEGKYWRRRLKDKSVEICQPKTMAEEKKEEKNEPKKEFKYKKGGKD